MKKIVKIKMENRVLIIAVIFWVALNVFFTEQAQGKKEGDMDATAVITPTPPITLLKSISGKVGIIRGGYITIIYKEEKRPDGTTIKDYEMVLPIDETLVLSHIKTINELNEGDRVEIEYEETSWIDEKGIGRIERKAKQVRFISPAVKGLRSQ